MRTVALCLIVAMLGACASPPPLQPAPDLFHDELFEPLPAPIRTDQVMAVSAEMRQYLTTKILNGGRYGERRQRLIDALYNKQELRLEYDARETRNAAQTFDARSGNCLALVLMTAAFAKEMGLGVRYQLALDGETWDRSQDLYISAGHVNLALDDRPGETGGSYMFSDPLVVDFLPPRNAQHLRTRIVPEQSIVALYLNNRAVESFADGDANAAYWYARAAVRQDPGLTSPYITLAVIYRAKGHAELAESALAAVLRSEADNTKALSNRVLVLRDLGRQAEADAVLKRLETLQPHPPFSYFHEGLAAFREHRYAAARDLFAKEVDRAPYHHEFHFWLAIAYLALNDPQSATAQLAKAKETSTTRKDHDRYALKLEHLKSLGYQ